MRINSARRQATWSDINTALSGAGGCYIRGYSGTQPANVDTALSGNTLLFELRGSTTYGTVSTGTNTNETLTAGTISSAAAAATGTLSFIRILATNGTTAIMDLTVGTSGADVNFNTLSITSGVTVSISSLVHTFPLGT